MSAAEAWLVSCRIAHTIFTGIGGVDRSAKGIEVIDSILTGYQPVTAM